MRTLLVVVLLALMGTVGWQASEIRKLERTVDGLSADVSDLDYRVGDDGGNGDLASRISELEDRLSYIEP